MAWGVIKMACNLSLPAIPGSEKYLNQIDMDAEDIFITDTIKCDY